MFDFLKVDLIPSKPDIGCLGGKTGYKCNPIWHRCFETCHCEDHCAWDKCRLTEPANECLIGTNSTWVWSSQNNYWVAQKSTQQLHEIIGLFKFV